MSDSLEFQIERPSPFSISHPLQKFELDDRLRSDSSNSFDLKTSLHFARSAPLTATGRRKTGSRGIAQIKIVIDDHVEVFNLELETLCSRKRSLQRARALHYGALAYLNRLENVSKGDMHEVSFSEPHGDDLPLIPPLIEVNLGADPDNPSDTVGYEALEHGFGDESSTGDNDDFLGLSWAFIQ
jgi:hypothetical protein